MTILDDILSKSDSLTEVTSITSEAFKKNHFNKKQPVVIKGFAKNWGASQKWNFDYLLGLKDDNEIDLLSGNFIQDDNRFKKGTFKDYIQKLKNAEINNEPFKDYLTTLDIFKFFPHLKKDIDFSLFEEHTKLNEITAWIGPAGTISGFHQDTGKNMYAQIKGKKMFILSATKFNKKMYPSDKYVSGAVPSKVDINNFNPEKFPKFQEVEFKSIILEPGDVLYVPQLWWHYVQALDTSISISNFGFTTYEVYTLKIMERIKHSLHKRGYYKPKNCFCCAK